jgi:C_GCAxxG_C_C family probable redox protein
MSKIDTAVTCFNEGFTCGQAVLSAFGEDLGLNRELALKIACAFGGGMGCMGRTCGAVTGAFMVIGLKHGRTVVENREAKDKTYELTRKFRKAFEARNGSIVCHELLDVDISTPEGMKIAEDKELFKKRCPGFVKDAAEIIDELL